MQFYKNKKVLVTGASSGIGSEFCRQLASYGAELIITSRRKERLELLAKELEDRFDVKVTIVICDLSDTRAPHLLYEQVKKRNLHVDILINNAGFGYNGPFTDGDPEMYQQMMQINMNALVTLTRLFLPGMIQKGNGGVLNVASMAGFLPIPYIAIYSATKQFVINFSWSLWKELKGTGIHVSALCPGPVDTEFQEVAGIAKDNLTFRRVQSVESTVHAGLKGLAGNRVLKLSRAFLHIPYLLSRWVPVKLGMVVGAMAMKKQ